MGAQWPAALALAAFWAGREHSQAEYRWMAAHNANRNRMPWHAGWLPESWSRDSLLFDLLLPTAAALTLCLAGWWLGQ